MRVTDPEEVFNLRFFVFLAKAAVDWLGCAREIDGDLLDHGVKFSQEMGAKETKMGIIG